MIAVAPRTLPRHRPAGPRCRGRPRTGRPPPRPPKDFHRSPAVGVKHHQAASAQVEVPRRVLQECLPGRHVAAGNLRPVKPDDPARSRPRSRHPAVHVDDRPSRCRPQTGVRSLSKSVGSAPRSPAGRLGLGPLGYVLDRPDHPEGLADMRITLMVEHLLTPRGSECVSISNGRSPSERHRSRREIVLWSRGMALRTSS
jgi:hypothetical protein